VNIMIVLSGLTVAIWALFFWRGTGPDNPIPFYVAAAAVVLSIMGGIAEFRRRMRRRRELELRGHG
jgi:hypothetical protein